MKILIAGASGYIGSDLVRALDEEGHEVLRLVRRPATAGDEVEWHPDDGLIPGGVMDEVDAVVNLSGASLGRLPWTPGYKREIASSRIRATHTLTDAMRTATSPPSVFLSGSAVGYYGDRPGEKLTEDSPAGSGFLSDVVVAWEKAADRAPDGVRVVKLRTGLVVGKGGVLSIVELQARLGLAGPLGSGQQHWPWITLPDEVAAIRHLLSSRVDGPVNLVAPTPTTAERIMRAFTDELRRPYLIPAPKAIVSLALQDARDLLLADTDVAPERLLADGFTFRHPTPEEAIDWMLSGRRRPRRPADGVVRHARD
ncbi:TIGR01777 family protein [Glaciibacter flavus]|uniref:TIGR01777 family protein n=1 Tax=Orlajensenia flava TaxID=2565934 RepID=A0A4S4FWW6_9MICO|nr:TIGR01777 family oxidoreductase [Glaciibacter flavus]THG35490.1 TIGR01777 family protein [Glaciibacter flavus]